MTPNNINNSLPWNPSPNASTSRPRPVSFTDSVETDIRGWKAKFINAAAKVAVKVLRHYEPILAPSTLSLTSPFSSTTTSSLVTSRSSTEDPEDEEARWGPTKDIDPVLICRLAKRLVGHRYGGRCWLQEKHAGTFNQVYVVMFDDGADGIKIVLKVPATGWAPRWCEQDAIYLRSEALTLRFIHQKCDDVPFVPQMLAYDTTFDNEINAPFLLMTHLKGRPAWQVWGFMEDPDGPSWPVPHYDRRNNILSSLAAAMVKLKRVKFDAIGLPDYLDDNCKGPFVRTEFQSHEVASHDEKEEQELSTAGRVPHREWTEIPTFASTREFFLHWYHNVARRFKRSGTNQSLSYEDAGLVKFLRLLPDQIPRSRPDFSKDQPETFSLAHNDLDWQNILCDDYGNVTGIIDWEGACSRPASFGWAQVPLFLRRDLDTDCQWPWDTLECNLFPDQIQWYRKEYVAKLHELEPRRGSDKGPSHPAISYLTCSLYDTCRHSADDIGIWCDRFLRMAVPSLDITFFHRIGKGNGWIFLPRLSQDETMPLNKWLEQYNIYYYLNHGCSLMEQMLLNTPKPAKDCSQCWARDDDDNESEYSVGDISTKDGISDDDDISIFHSVDSRPSTTDALVALSSSSSSSPGTKRTANSTGSPRLPQITEGEDSDGEFPYFHDIQPVTSTIIGESTIHEATAAVSIPAAGRSKTTMSRYDTPIYKPVPQVASNSTAAIAALEHNIPMKPILPIPSQPHAPKHFTTEFYPTEHFAATEPPTIESSKFHPSKPESSKAPSSKANSSTSKATTEPFTPKLTTLASCTFDSPHQYQHTRGNKCNFRAKLERGGRKLKNMVVRPFRRW